MQLKVIQVCDLALLPKHSFSDLQAEGFSKGWRHCVVNLAVLVPDGAREIEVVPENINFKFWSTSRLEGSTYLKP